MEPTIIELKDTDAALIIGEDNISVFLPTKYENDEFVPDYIAFIASCAALASKLFEDGGEFDEQQLDAFKTN